MFGHAVPGNPNILFVVTQGASADDVQAPSSMLRKFGVKTFAVGIGNAAPKDLAGMSFSSSMIFKSALNGIAPMLPNIQNTAKAGKC